MNNYQDIKIYSSESIYKKGIVDIVKQMINNISESRDLIWQFFIRDFKARYNQSLLGWAWIFLMPIITMGTFLLLNISGVIRIGKIPVPYPIFGLLGFSLWQIFSNGWLVVTSSYLGGGSLINHIYFPREALVIASMGQVIVDFLIRMGLVIVVYLIYGLKPSLLFIIFPFFVLPIFLLTLGLGFLTAIMQVIFRDTKNFIGVGMDFFLFLMPIMYTLPEKGFLAEINKINPIFFLINVPRDLIISGKIYYPLEFILSVILTIVFFFLGWFIFYIVQPKLSERI